MGLSGAEVSAGSLSPRGQPSGKQQEEGSLVIDIFNLDPIIQQVHEQVNNGEVFSLVDKPKPRGTRLQIPSDRALRSKSKVSSNSFASLSHD